MANDSYLQLDYENKVKNKYSRNHQKKNGQAENTAPCIALKIMERMHLTHIDTLDRIYLGCILYVQCLQICLHTVNNKIL